MSDEAPDHTLPETDLSGELLDHISAIEDYLKAKDDPLAYLSALDAADLQEHLTGLLGLVGHLLDGYTEAWGVVAFLQDHVKKMVGTVEVSAAEALTKPAPNLLVPDTRIVLPS